MTWSKERVGSQVYNNAVLIFRADANTSSRSNGEDTTVMSWQAPYYDPLGMLQNSSTRVVLPEVGGPRYWVVCRYVWAAGAGSSRMVRCYLTDGGELPFFPGGDISFHADNVSGVAMEGYQANVVVPVNSGAYLNWGFSQQDSGASLNLSGSMAVFKLVPPG